MNFNPIKSNPYVALDVQQNEKGTETSSFGLGAVMKNTAEVIKTTYQGMLDAANWVSENKAKVGLAVLGITGIYFSGIATGALLEGSFKETSLTQDSSNTPANTPANGEYFYPLNATFSNLEEATKQKEFLEGMLERTQNAVQKFEDIACANNQYVVLEQTGSTGTIDRGLGFYKLGERAKLIVKHNGTGTCHIKLEGNNIISSEHTLAGLAFPKGSDQPSYILGAEENLGKNNIFFAQEVNRTSPSPFKETSAAVKIYKTELKTTCADIKGSVGTECPSTEVEWLNA